MTDEINGKNSASDTFKMSLQRSQKVFNGTDAHSASRKRLQGHRKRLPGQFQANGENILLHTHITPK